MPGADSHLFSLLQTFHEPCRLLTIVMEFGMAIVLNAQERDSVTNAGGE
jgi:hypothetical protein